MSKKSIFLSILAMLVFAAVAVGIVLIFKMGILFGILGIFLLLIPAGIQRKALSEANGGFDKIFAKYFVPAFAVIATLVVIMSIYFILR